MYSIFNLSSMGLIIIKNTIKQNIPIIIKTILYREGKGVVADN